MHTALRDVYIKLGRLRDASKVQDRIDRILKEMPRVADLPAEPEPPVLEAQAPPVVARPAAPPKPAPSKPAPAPAQPEPAPPAPAQQKPAPVPEPPKPKKKDKDEKAEPTLPPAPPQARPAPQPVAQASFQKAVPEAGKRPRARTESLGQILLDEGIVSREQLEKAIHIQQRSGGHLGRILVEQGAVSEQQLAKALSVQWGLDVVELGAIEIDPEVVKVVPHHIAQRHKVLAIAKTKKKLRLAIADPLNVVALDDVRLVTGLEIEAVVAAEDEILADRKSTRLNSSHIQKSRMPSSA